MWGVHGGGENTQGWGTRSPGAVGLRKTLNEEVTVTLRTNKTGRKGEPGLEWGHL